MDETHKEYNYEKGDNKKRKSFLILIVHFALV